MSEHSENLNPGPLHAGTSLPNVAPGGLINIQTVTAKSIQAAMEKAKGPNYWRSLDELAATEGFQEVLHREFPRQASEWVDDEGRRNFLKLMGASLALAGLTGCTRQPTEYVLPYVNTPENLIPGKPMFYATAFPVQGVANPVLVEAHDFRPTKVEGNPEHPASLGSADVPTQASILGLYDPDRCQTVSYITEPRTYGSFLTVFKGILEKQAVKGGAGIRILTETVTSPTLYSQLQAVLKQYPGAKWYQWDPTGHGRRTGGFQAFGQYVNTVYKFDQAEIILSVDSNFLGNGPGGVRYAKDFAAKRKLHNGKMEMSRFYAVETTPTSTNAKADHRLAVKPSQVAPFVRALAAAVSGGSASGDFASNKFFTVLVKDLLAAKGKSVVIAGEDQSPEVHALVHYVNQALGNLGKSVIITESLEQKPTDQMADLKSLVQELNAGQVDLLMILGGNPVYNAPADWNLRGAVQLAKMRVRLGLYEDETSEVCQWVIPETHPYEAWTDVPAFDGTMTIAQPLIAPLYGGKSAHDLLTAFQEQAQKPAYDVIKANWQAKKGGADFETWWNHVVHDGFIKDSALPAKNPTAKLVPAAASAASSGIEVVFHSDPYILDGRYSNNGWLQELPRPISRLMWDNAVVMSEKTAKELGVKDEDKVEVSVNGQTVTGAAWRLAGHPDGVISLALGYGREKAGRAGNGAGINAYRLRMSSAPYFATGAGVKKVGGVFKLAAAQHHFQMEGRNPVHVGSLEEYKKNPKFSDEQGELPGKGMTVLPDTWHYEGYAWGMAIDLNSCTGCNACVVACQSENNIAVVGKEQAINGREMHWIRIDRYYKGEADNPETYFEPVGCVHCENAPCEVVCPVAATEHDQEGLNNMVYNRCVGTRYCSNNCPYKVRRFNFLLYTDWETESLKLQRNPDVSVRSRGVMEKCTYCVQRINYAKITAEKQERRVQDGEIVTACQATCPSDAIAFGDLNDPKSKVSQWKREKLSFGLLAELNTRPRTTHLAEVRNHHPELGGVKES